MGKEKRACLHQSLAQQILEADAPRAKRRAKVREEKPEHDEFVAEKLTKKILHQARGIGGRVRSRDESED